MPEPVYYQAVEKCVDDVIAKIGKTIIMAIPLGIGKPNQLVNAFFNRAKQDPTVHLKILTALTLEKPQGKSALEKRFLEPFVARVFADYPELDYAAALRKGLLPPNVEIAEFFFKPGGFLQIPHAQQNYISSNYTAVARDLLEQGVNVLAQLVAEKTIDGKRCYSLGSNPEVTLDMLSLLQQREKVVVIGQVNDHMPFMYHDALVEPAVFDGVVDNPAYDFTLFSLPNMPVDVTDYMIGVNASTLIKDGGTLQIGIGALGDAIVYACLLRHKNNDLYQSLLTRLNLLTAFPAVIQQVGATTPFTQGLYGASEMFVNGFWHLYREGILKRRVYDNVPLQRLLNEGSIGEAVTPETLMKLQETGAIQVRLSRADFDFLQQFGVFKPDLRYESGCIRVADRLWIAADLDNADSRKQIIEHCLGSRLQNGIVMHAGFFMGPQSLYEALRTLPEAESKAFFMTRISRVNQLYGDEELAVLQRSHARFINTTIMVTLSGAAVSDGLDDGQVISGVGGQYNFVAMAHALPGARSILMLRSTREKQGVVQSNIVWNYGHITIPRHLRDIVLTEYGIADLRGKSDKDIIIALLNITDSRFQEDLLEKAKKSGKMPQDYQIPAQFRNNTPQRLETELAFFKAQGLFPDFPFGTDFTPEEITLGKVLKHLQRNLGSIGTLIKSVFRAAETGQTPEAAWPYLARLQLDKPDTWKEEIIQKMIVAELIAGGHILAD